MSKTTSLRASPTARQSRNHGAVELLECRRLLSASADYVAGELLVKFQPGVGPAAIQQFYASHGVSEREALDQHYQGKGGRLKLVSVPAAQTMRLASALARDSRVAYVEPNYVYHNVTSTATPTETLYPVQWALNNFGQWSTTPDADIDAPEAWNITTGSPDVLVAVFDTGTDYNHPDLAANIWTNPGEIAGDGVDNDGNGYVDDIHGINAVNDSGDPMDDQGHGTLCAGVIGAVPFNEGTVGVAWRVGMIPVKIITAEDTLKISDVVQGFQYVNYLKNVQHLNIVATSNSWRGYAARESQALKDAMAGVDQPGMNPILHVCAAGNENLDNDVALPYPTSYNLDNIISVAATDWNDLYADFSNYGATTVDLGAPGVTIPTTAWDNDYAYTFGGTSAATPHVAGAAALVWSAFPGLSAAQVKQRILAGVDPISQIGANSQKPTLTNGRLNIAKALAGAPVSSDSQAPAAVATLAAGGATFQSVTLTWTATGDNGSTGRAALYDIRYSTSPIKSNNWDAAVRVLGEPGAAAAGATESFAVTGLDPSKTYYFALKVRDDAGNLSSLSNVATASTTAAQTLFSDNVESGTNGWTASGLWHRSTRRSNSPANSWYYGSEATGTYDTGAANSGTLTSPLIDLRKNAVSPVLIYREWREMEDVTFLDSAKVQVNSNGKTWETVYQSEFSTALAPTNWEPSAAEIGWNVPQTPGTPQWVSRAVDFSAYAGKTIRVRFVFDTVDATHNAFEGWYVDDVNIFGATKAVAAASSSAMAASGSTSVATSTRAKSAWESLQGSDDELTLL